MIVKCSSEDCAHYVPQYCGCGYDKIYIENGKCADYQPTDEPHDISGSWIVRTGLCAGIVCSICGYTTHNTFKPKKCLNCNANMSNYDTKSNKKKNHSCDTCEHFKTIGADFYICGKQKGILHRCDDNKSICQYYKRKTKNEKW